jgi:lipopolysaccharide export system permease protein
MPILDQYVLRLFVKVLVVTFISVAGMYTVIDAFGNLDEFISYSQTHGGLGRVMFEYYGSRALSVFDGISGLLGLVAALFAVSWLERSNELVAVMAAGVPKSRMVRPLIGGAIAVSLLAALNREFVLPALRDQLTRTAQDLLGDRTQTLRPCYDNQTNILIGGAGCFVAERRIDRPNFQLHTPLGEFGRQLIAAKAVYRPQEEGRPSGYLLEGVQEPRDIARIPTAHYRGQPVLFSPHDTPWLEPDQCFVATAVTFDQICGGAAWQRYSSTAELILGLRNPSLDYGADTRVMAHARFVQPLLDVTLLFLGLPLVLTRESRNIFLSLALGLAVVCIFFLVVLACHALGISGLLSPALAAWCPLLIFGPLAVAASSSMRE